VDGTIGYVNCSEKRAAAAVLSFVLAMVGEPPVYSFYCPAWPVDKGREGRWWSVID